MTGASPVRPPSIPMRLIADGPGYAYLMDHCDIERLIYCRVLSQSDQKSDALLWSKEERTSLFRVLTPDEQHVSAAQQSRSVRAVRADRPAEVIWHALGNTVSQLAQLDLNGFNYSRENRGRFRETIPAELFGPLSQTRAYRNIMPTKTIWPPPVRAKQWIGCEPLFVRTYRHSRRYLRRFVGPQGPL